MPVKNQPRPPRFRQITNILLLVSGLFLLVNIIFPGLFAPPTPQVPYSLFIHQIESGEVQGASIGQNQIRYQLKSEPSSEQPSPVFATTPIFDLELPKLLEEKGVEFAATPPPKNGWLTGLLSWVIPPLIFVAVWQFFQNRGGGGSQGVLSIGKSKAKVYVEGEAAKTTFADVAGVEEAKTELVEVVDFLKDSARFTEIGARIPKGLLLVGPPGTGKTLLAKAVAGEAGVPFFSISGSEFVEMFVGVGSSRVRDLFEQAKKQAPCIVFIDELDAIGKSRGGNGFYGGNDEREQTLNQLLTEMDGFAADKTVIVLAATNRPEILDSALLRPGRFDRQVLVDRPDLLGREEILKIHSRKVKLGQDIDLRAIATRTPGFAGADLANLVNEAALLAARERREAVAQEDFAEAIERVVAGLEKKSRVLNDKEKKIVAYHEVGHALVAAQMPGSGRVEKISIVPRGMAALGYTLQLPTEDRFLLDEAELRGQIATMLGGRSAEEVVFGSITTGASNDLQRATDVAERMVMTYGMSKVLGPQAYEQQQAMFLGNGTTNQRRPMSEQTAEAIDSEIKEIVEAGHQQALDVLQHNRDLLETITTQLLETEVIEGKTLQHLLNQAESVDRAPLKVS